jgi:hypothetical protein
VAQATGFDRLLPTGEGLIAFTDLDEAVSAVEAVQSDWQRHSKRARELAEAYLDSRRVLSKLLDAVGSS